MTIGTPAQQAIAITSPGFLSWFCDILVTRKICVSQLDINAVESLIFDASRLADAFEQLDYNLGPWAPRTTPDFCGLRIHLSEDGRWGLFFSERADCQVLGLFSTKKEAYREYAEITRGKAIAEIKRHINRLKNER